jgi:ABC-type branched-subunit amino acid transport system ATPase component
MIHKVRIQNFKCLRDVSVELERFTVFAGVNGSGKTSVLESIHNAVRASTGDPQKVFAHERHGDWVYTRGGVGDLSIHCETAGGVFSIEATPPEGYPPSPELMQKGRWEYRVSPSAPPLVSNVVSSNSGRASYQVSPYAPQLQTALEPARRMVFLHFNAADMAKPSYSQDDPPRIEYTGEGLASVLAYMALNNPQGFEELVGEARTLIPRLRTIRFRKATVHRTESELVRFGNDTVKRTSRRPYQGELILFDFEHAENVSARTASEGTMLMLGLLTVLLGPTRPRILLLDDIEHGLHPLAQKQMVEVIGRVLMRYPDLQVLSTSHSPYLLDQLQPEQIRLMTLGNDGYSVCGRLEEHPQFEKWKDEMAPGELWSLFGEKWIAEGATSK